MLKGAFPFQTMWFYPTPVRFKGHQMRNFVDECNEESVFIERGIDSNLMQPIGQPTIVAMPSDPMVYNL